MSDTNYLAGKLDAILGAAAKLLLHQNCLLEVSILTNAETALSHREHDDWNGGQDVWTLYLGIPADTYLSLKERQSTEKVISDAIAIPIQAISDSDFINVEITTALENDPDWRSRIRQHLSGEAITNQGRVRSDNVAARSHDGLLFRSRPEVYFYDALKAIGVVFAPLSVVIGGGTVGQRPRRIEPDFVIFKDGLVTVVEIDGDLYHVETPVQAQQRLKFLLDEGPRLERISASECDTPQKAKEAAGRIMLGIEKRLRSKL